MGVANWYDKPQLSGPGADPADYDPPALVEGEKVCWLGPSGWVNTGTIARVYNTAVAIVPEAYLGYGPGWDVLVSSYRVLGKLKAV